MYNHAPKNYACPFCLVVQGVVNEHVLSRQTDVVYRDGEVLALVSSHQSPNTSGHVLVIPTAHHENLYELPLDLATRIHELARAVALAMKRTFACDGISTYQHNEPAGNQDVWHYHLHVFPRYVGDDLYNTQRALMPVEDRAVYAEKLRAALAEWVPTTLTRSVAAPEENSYEQK
jgi:histidine triad (HIT) family protein